MSAGGRLFSVQVPDWGQDHLTVEAVAAYVDGELAERPYDRATRHLAACPECAAQVVAQGQARAALRSARCPSLPSSLMSALRSIPHDTELPGPPNGLAMSPDGELVSPLDSPRPIPRRPPGSPTHPPSRVGPASARVPRSPGWRSVRSPSAPSIIAGDTPASAGPSVPPSIDAHLQLPGAP